MILKFPDLATLRFALTSGAVPAAVGDSPAVAGDGEDGSLLIETEASLPRSSQIELKNLGALTLRAASGLATEVSCWAEILPLQPDPVLPDAARQGPGLFKLLDSAALGSLVSEILRLGNDRQSFRWLEGSGGKSEALLRVV